MLVLGVILFQTSCFFISKFYQTTIQQNQERTRVFSDRVMKFIICCLEFQNLNVLICANAINSKLNEVSQLPVSSLFLLIYD